MHAQKKYLFALRHHVFAGHGVLCRRGHAVPAGGGAERLSDHGHRRDQRGAVHGAGDPLGLGSGPPGLPAGDDPVQRPVSGHKDHFLAGGKLSGLPDGTPAAGGGHQRPFRRGRQHAVSFRPAPGCPAQFRLVFCRRGGGRAAVRPALHGLSQRPIPANGAVDGGYLCAGCPVDLIFAGSAPRGRPKAAGAPGQAGPSALPRAGNAGAGDLRRSVLRGRPLRDDLL